MPRTQLDVHERITDGAYQSSDGLTTFLNENLEAATLEATVPVVKSGTETRLTKSPREWVKYGSIIEDEQVYRILFYHALLRVMDHFYDLTPDRTPGQLIGLDDTSEPWYVFGWLPGQITNSFVWASIDVLGPKAAGVSVGTNLYNWQRARAFEFAALTSTNQFDRNTNMAMLLCSLGHILHLNQDDSVPSHVRNDSHYVRAYFEKFGELQCTNNTKRWFVLPTNATVGWANWESQGFTNLLSFWDRNKYNNASGAQSIKDDADGKPGKKLGLAEFSNGNFLGENALYKECADIPEHVFPFPTLDSTTYSRTKIRELNDVFLSSIHPALLNDGKLVNRIYLNKEKDGITISNHCALSYLGVAWAARQRGACLPATPAIQRVAVSINDTNVLQAYHDILVPKAVEYSAGILDYFFRGTMDVSIPGYDTNSPTFTNVVLNTSGQDFHGGTFFMFQEATNGTRTQILQTNLSDVITNVNGIFTNGTSVQLICPGPISLTNKYLLVYQGTIGWTNDVAFDLVDSNICIAAARSLFVQTKTYTYHTNLLDIGLTNGSTITTNLESDDFDFVPGRYAVRVNTAYFDDNGAIGCDDDGWGGIPAPEATNANWPHDPLTNVVIPAEAVTVVGNRLRVNITATDVYGTEIGWVDVNITWRAWPAP